MFAYCVEDRVLSLIRDMGACVVDDRTRLRGLLLDYCMGARREADLLLMIADMGLIKRLKRPDVLTEFDVIKYERQLQDRKSVTAYAARWGIATWLYALSDGKIVLGIETESGAGRWNTSVMDAASRYAANGRRLYLINSVEFSEFKQEKLIDM